MSIKKEKGRDKKKMRKDVEIFLKCRLESEGESCALISYKVVSSLRKLSHRDTENEISLCSKKEERL